jgi:hypothetical protein
LCYLKSNTKGAASMGIGKLIIAGTLVIYGACVQAMEGRSSQTLTSLLQPGTAQYEVVHTSQIWTRVLTGRERIKKADDTYYLVDDNINVQEVEELSLQDTLEHRKKIEAWIKKKQILLPHLCFLHNSDGKKVEITTDVLDQEYKKYVDAVITMAACLKEPTLQTLTAHLKNRGDLRVLTLQNFKHLEQLNLDREQAYDSSQSYRSKYILFSLLAGLGVIASVWAYKNPVRLAQKIQSCLGFFASKIITASTTFLATAGTSVSAFYFYHQYKTAYSRYTQVSHVVQETQTAKENVRHSTLILISHTLGEILERLENLEKSYKTAKEKLKEREEEQAANKKSSPLIVVTIPSTTTHNNKGD